MTNVMLAMRASSRHPILAPKRFAETICRVGAAMFSREQGCADKNAENPMKTMTSGL